MITFIYIYIYIYICTRMHMCVYVYVWKCAVCYCFSSCQYPKDGELGLRSATSGETLVEKRY